jgi:hypothetical protein
MQVLYPRCAGLDTVGRFPGRNGHLLIAVQACKGAWNHEVRPQMHRNICSP